MSPILRRNLLVGPFVVLLAPITVALIVAMILFKGLSDACGWLFVRMPRLEKWWEQ